MFVANNVISSIYEHPEASCTATLYVPEAKFENINTVGNFNYTNKLEKEVQLNKNDLKEIIGDYC